MCKVLDYCADIWAHCGQSLDSPSVRSFDQLTAQPNEPGGDVTSCPIRKSKFAWPRPVFVQCSPDNGRVIGRCCRVLAIVHFTRGRGSNACGWNAHGRALARNLARDLASDGARGLGEYLLRRYALGAPVIVSAHFAHR
ncbi:MAG: hypothetical protein ACI8PT_003020 [Gammaproteobacteria bacterium]|jgi:hypothetical protein